MSAPILVYSFGTAWGVPVPTVSPFGLKLVTWLRIHGVEHELRVENNPGKGPKGKCPWAVIDGEALADSQLVIERIAALRKVAPPAITPHQAALATATRLMLEEHYHQVWEHELFIHEGGWQRGQEFWDFLPPGLRIVIRAIARAQLRKQLHARGVGRHAHDRIVGMGKVVLDAVDELLGDGPYFFGPEPTDIDAVVFGFLALTQWAPGRSPVWDHCRARPRLGAYCQRMVDRYYPAGQR